MTHLKFALELVETKTVLARLIEKWEMDNLLTFSPSKDFYEHLKINRIRFAQLVNGKKRPLSTEIAVLADYFKVPVSEFFK